MAAPLPPGPPPPPPPPPSAAAAAASGGGSSGTAAASVGVPIKVLQEAEGLKIACEVRTGEVYQGTLTAAEPTMNVHLANVVHTARDGRVTKCVPLLLL